MTMDYKKDLYEELAFNDVPDHLYLVGDKLKLVPESMRVLKGETTSHTSYSKSAKGNITIQEVAPDGKYIVLENMARREENIGDWKLRRKVLGKPEKTFIFPNGFILGPQRTVKIYARGQGIHAPPDSLVYDMEDSWGTGTDVQTTLYNREGEERASHSQRASHA